MTVKESLETFREDISETAAGTVEAVVAPRSPLVGKALGQLSLEEKYRVACLALYREGGTIYGARSTVPVFEN